MSMTNSPLVLCNCTLPAACGRPHVAPFTFTAEPSEPARLHPDDLEASHGTETGSSDDSEGVAHVVKFTRPTDVLIYVAITLVKVAHDDADPETYPTDGDAQVEAAIVAYGDGRPTGWNVRSAKIAAQADAVAGVLEVTACYIGTAPSPVASTTIPIGLRERAVFDTSRITVTTSDGTP